MYINSVFVILELFPQERYNELNSIKKKMLVALFPLVDRKRSNRTGNNPNQIQNWPSINGKYENTLYTCIYQKHEVPVYTVEICLNYKQEPNLSPELSFHSSSLSQAHTVSFCIITFTLLCSWTHPLLDKFEEKSFNLQSLYKQ